VQIGEAKYNVNRSAAVTTVSVSSGTNPSIPGQSVTFTATVSPDAATGTVMFKEGVTTLGSGTLSGGVATFSTSALSVGTHSITLKRAVELVENGVNSCCSS